MSAPRFKGELDGRSYVAALNRRGKLDVRCAASYIASPGKDSQFMLSVYVSAAYVNAGKRGGEIRIMDVCVAREYAPTYTPHEEQARRLEFMATIAATRLGTDFEHRLPISTRPPK